MWHRQSCGDDLIGLDIDHTTTIVPPIAPTIGDVRLAYRRYKFDHAMLQGKAIEMTTIFRGQTTEERWLPQRNKTMCLANGRQTAEQRVHKYYPATRLNSHVVNI